MSNCLNSKLHWLCSAYRARIVVCCVSCGCLPVNCYSSVIHHRLRNNTTLKHVWTKTIPTNQKQNHAIRTPVLWEYHHRDYGGHYAHIQWGTWGTVTNVMTVIICEELSFSLPRNKYSPLNLWVPINETCYYLSMLGLKLMYDYKRETWGSLCYHGLKLIPAWISNHMPS